MSRKLDTKRLYKLSKIIVNIVTIYSLVVGGVGLYRLNDFNLKMLKEFRTCSLTASGSPMQACGFYLDIMSEHEQEVINLLLLGIFTPLIFYGGGALIRYLFPEKKR